MANNRNIFNFKNLGTTVIITLAVSFACYFFDNKDKFNLISEAQATNLKHEKKELLEQPATLKARNEQIIYHTGYTVSYNCDWLIPNWVAYEITSDEASGECPRANNFIPDPLVKCASAYSYDYSKSGYDRGHMAPAGDMKWSQQAMNESFYLSNICPQDKNLNGGDWNKLEERVRGWARNYGAVYVVCGPVMAKDFARIGEHGVAVPAGFFKALLRKTKNGYTAIGFLFKNEPCKNKLSVYAKSIDEIESITGINLFPLLDDKIESEVEKTYNLKDWNLQ